MASSRRRTQRNSGGLARRQDDPIFPEEREGQGERNERIYGIEYRGPLPPPGMLREYDQIVPGAADRIITLMERQQDHRHGMESSNLKGNQGNERLGIYAAVFIVVIVCGGGMVLAWNGRETAGLVGMVTPLATLAGVFVYGRFKSGQDQAEKRSKIQAVRKGQRR